MRTITVGGTAEASFFVRLESDYNTPAITESGGQPQVSKNGAPFDPYGIGTLTAVGYGRYTATLDTSLISVAVGDYILTRYKGILTSETEGDSFLVVSANGTLPDDNPSVAYYGSVTDANLFFSQRLNAKKWVGSTSDDKRKSLIMATQLIDKLNFIGCKANSTQTLQFPRSNDANVPTDIKFATYLTAVMLLAGYDPELEAEKLMKTMSKYQSVQSFYEREYIPEYLLAGIPSAQAWGYIKPYLRDIREIEISRV